MSGRALRKLPIKAHAFFLQRPTVRYSPLCTAVDQPGPDYFWRVVCAGDVDGVRRRDARHHRGGEGYRPGPVLKRALRSRGGSTGPVVAGCIGSIEDCVPIVASVKDVKTEAFLLRTETIL